MAQPRVVRGSSRSALVCVVDPLVHVSDFFSFRAGVDVIEHTWTNTGIAATGRIVISWTGFTETFGGIVIDDDEATLGVDEAPPDNTDVTSQLEVLDSCGAWQAIATWVFNTGD